MIRWTASLAGLALLAGGAVGAGRPMVPADLARIATVSDPQVDASGQWVAYVVETTDAAADKHLSHLWMTSWDGKRTVQLTARAGESESTPRFSPDGQSIAFVSARGDAHENAQLWLMSRAGGEGTPLPGISGSVVDVSWAPDSRSLALVVEDPDPAQVANAAASAELPPAVKPGAPLSPGNEAPSPGAAPGTTAKDAKQEQRPRPIVIDRFQFKADIEGYLTARRKRLWLYDLATHSARRLTTGDYDEALPAWSPDGRSIAFTSKRAPDPDRTYDSNLYVVAAGSTPAEPRALTRFAGQDNDPEWGSYPAWSPDGRSIAYLQGGPVELFSYGVHALAVVPAAGGEPRVLTAKLDRNVLNPSWSADGRLIRFLVEDDGTIGIRSVGAAGGKVKAVAGGTRVFFTPMRGGGDHLAVVGASFAAPAEIFALDPGGTLRQLSHANDALVAELALAPVTRTSFRSKDGTEIHGWQVTPLGAAPGTRLPTALINHGGPQWQSEADFNPNWQILAAHGYLVVSSNPRGSTGRGEAFAKALYADWGGPAVPDALAAVDDAIARGVADPARLVVGGWSYGGMLTNYLIASDTRFKAAVSGAGISNILAGYGTDQYIRDYEVELGLPWKNTDVWLRNSYPFFHNDRIVTPTLFMVGDKDFNVPLQNSEQMYQALKSRGIGTRLVIYPGEFHGIDRPSFLVDRMERWLAWYDAQLK